MKRTLKSLGWGLLVGTAAGLLLAPDAGKETRQSLKIKGQDMLEKASNAIDSSSRTAEHRMEQFGQQLQEVRDEFPDKSDVLDTVQTAEGKLQRLRRDAVRAVTE